MSAAAWLTIPIGICVLVVLAVGWRMGSRVVCGGCAGLYNGRHMIVMLGAVLVGSGLGMARFLVGA